MNWGCNSCGSPVAVRRNRSRQVAFQYEKPFDSCGTCHTHCRVAGDKLAQMKLLIRVEGSMKMLFCLLVSTSLSAAAQDCSGVWKVDGSIQDQTIAATCTLKQAGADITGTCKVDADKSLDVKGGVTDKQVTWRYDEEYEGTVYTLTYTGTLETDTSIKGSIIVSPSDTEGSFTAQKQDQPGANE